MPSPVIAVRRFLYRFRISAKDRLYLLSQDKKILVPIINAQVNKGNSKNPKSIEYPYIITARTGIFTNDIFG